ncbi:hypothetical protein D3C73_834920 [compost metagenome]
MQIAVLPHLIPQNIVISFIISLVIRISIIHHFIIGTVRGNRIAYRHTFIHDLHEIIDHPIHRDLKIPSFTSIHITADLNIKEGVNGEYGDKNAQQIDKQKFVFERDIVDDGRWFPFPLHAAPLLPLGISPSCILKAKRHSAL